jgi:hypothetical protein
MSRLFKPVQIKPVMLPFRAEVRVSACASDLVVPADDMHQAANVSHGLLVNVGEVWRCIRVTVDAKVCIFADLASLVDHRSFTQFSALSISPRLQTQPDRSI